MLHVISISVGSLHFSEAFYPGLNEGKFLNAFFSKYFHFYLSHSQCCSCKFNLLAKSRNPLLRIVDDTCMRYAVRLRMQDLDFAHGYLFSTPL